ncbi:MAG: Phosphoheptose isomerase [Chloroflexi bacterium ADurb.Bin325]|nr:MAG: Phosphoheptose isomerase [Chloroflexi bacterium ADurb.Bin325]
MNHLTNLLGRYPELTPIAADIAAACDLLAASYRAGGKALICGNGGSASDSEHIVGELMKGFLMRRPTPDALRAQLQAVSAEEGAYLADHLQGALPAISLVSHTALITAFANDVAADMIFAQQVYGYGRPGDVLIGISTSGNAANVRHALQVARAVGVHTIGLTGATGGRMLPFCDVAIRVPVAMTADVQERHLAIYHALCAQVEALFFAE